MSDAEFVSRQFKLFASKLFEVALLGIRDIGFIGTQD